MIDEMKKIIETYEEKGDFTYTTITEDQIVEAQNILCRTYNKIQSAFVDVLENDDTGVQQTIIYLGYITSDTPTFDEIARRAGLKTADKAKNEYELAFITIKNFLAHSRRFRKRK